MRVYRLERNGVGPFLSGTDYKAVTSDKKEKRSNHMRHQFKKPKRYADKHFQAIRDGEYVFAARTKEGLKAYFKYNLQNYFKQGYRIKIYEVPECDIIDLGMEIAFHVKHHKLKTVENVRKRINYS